MFTNFVASFAAVIVTAAITHFILDTNFYITLLAVTVADVWAKVSFLYYKTQSERY